MTASVQSPRSRRRLDFLFFGFLSLFVIGALLLPVFPSGDGPVHIYLAQIMGSLARGAGGIYGQVYVIRHLIQPYSLHYFWLIGFRHWLQPETAEKLFVAAILLVNSLGFRRLAHKLGPEGAAVSLAILPFLPGWALGAGFLNFCFSSGIMFFAYAEYLAMRSGETAARWFRYMLLLFLLVLAHPVPLMVLILLLSGEGLLLLFARSQRNIKTIALSLLLACIAFVGPMLIADKAQVAGSIAHDVYPHLQQIRAILLGYRLSLFAGGTLVGALLTFFLLVALPISAAITLSQLSFKKLRSGTSSPSERLCIVGLVFLFATIVFPQSMNGSALFADRMLPIAWPVVIACAAGIPFGAKLRTGWITAATGATTLSLLGCLLYLLPVARAQASLDHAPLPSEARGLFVTTPVAKRPFGEHLRSSLMVWAGARVFAAHDDVLLDTPWMQLTIVPVGERGHSGLLRDHLPGQLSEDPSALYALLQGGSSEAHLALQSADFLLFSTQETPHDDLVEQTRSLFADDTEGWQCAYGTSYAVCRHERR